MSCDNHWCVNCEEQLCDHSDLKSELAAAKADIDQLLNTNHVYREKLERLRWALETIVKDMKKERPERGDWTGNSDDDYEWGYDAGIYDMQEIAQSALDGGKA